MLKLVLPIGEVIPSHMWSEGLDEDTLLEALREHGIVDVSETDMAVLEIDGTISVVPVDTETRHIHRPLKPTQRL